MLSNMQSTCLTALKRDDEEAKQLTEADQLTATVTEDEDHVTTEDDVTTPDAVFQLDQESEVRIERDNKVMHKFLMANHGDICLYLCIILLLVSSLIALVIVVLQIVLPYKRAQTFHNTSCVTSGVRIAPGNTCSCGVGCTATYRCLVITVTYLDHVTMRHANATFYENESAMGKECSFYPPCRHSPNRAEESVTQYEQQYGTVGRAFPCLYNAEQHLRQHILLHQQQEQQQQQQKQHKAQNATQLQHHPQSSQQHPYPPHYPQPPSAPRPQVSGIRVIRTKVLTLYHVLHGLLWSSSILLASLVGLGVTVRKRGCHLYGEEE